MISLQDGVEEQYVLYWPPNVADAEGSLACRALILMKRVGGLLLLCPKSFLPMADLQAASVASEETLLGPHTVLSVPAVSREAEDFMPAGFDLDIQVVDASVEVLQGLVRMGNFSGAVAVGSIAPFSEDINLLLDASTLFAFIQEWVAFSGSQRAAFYLCGRGRGSHSRCQEG